MYSLLDRAIVEVYCQLDTPADQIVTDPEIANQFAELVRRKLPDGQCPSVAEINKRVLNLRRRGEDNGGLPRIRRRYKGRNGDGFENQT